MCDAIARGDNIEESKCLDHIKYRFQDGDCGKGATKERQKK